LLCLFALILALTGCKSGGGTNGGGADGPYACDARERLNLCTEWPRLGRDGAESMCNSSNGTFIEGACPAAGIVLRCARGEGTNEVHDVFYDSGYDLQDATSQCQMMGGTAVE
jgi:hypothetical protein